MDEHTYLPVGTVCETIPVEGDSIGPIVFESVGFPPSHYTFTSDFEKPTGPLATFIFVGAFCRLEPSRYRILSTSKQTQKTSFEIFKQRVILGMEDE